MTVSARTAGFVLRCPTYSLLSVSPVLGVPVAITIGSLVRTAQQVVEAVLSPLRRGNGPNKFQLSAMDTATVTNHRAEGWRKRPPATLECRRCSSDIHQHNAYDRIECPRCVAEYAYDEFPDLDLRYLTCPVCDSRMIHGKRHPEQFEIPEWASCANCRFHWEFSHFYG